MSEPSSRAKKRTADLAGIYGVDVWQGKSADGTIDSTKLVRFPASNPRAGLFTRAGYSFSGARDTNPIIRGARIRKDYFCESLQPPAAFNLSPDIPLSGPPTIRNIIVANTENPGKSCIGCHKNFINPLGFSLENYDAYGRYRTNESIFSADGTMVTQVVPINADAIPFMPADNKTEVSDGVGMSQHLGTSLEFNACFVRHYFRFSQARSEDDRVDGCKMNKMMDALTNGPTSSIQTMAKSLSTAPDFQSRNINP